MKILVVDNEAATASALAGMLVQSGWSAPVVATSGEEAVEWINQNGPIDLLVADVFLQPTDGITLRDTLLQHIPSLKTIFTTAYDTSEVASRIAATPLLAKPVDARALDAAVRQLSSAPSPVAVRAVAVARPKATPASVSSLPFPADLPPDEFVGCGLGDYVVEAKIGEHSGIGIYRATQRSVSRSVALYVLRGEAAVDPVCIRRFLDDASVKAGVSHPFVFAVYEAGEDSGYHFYSSEYMPCRSLRQIRESGGTLDELTALNALKVTANVLNYFSINSIARESIDENAILIGPGNQPRVTNIAVSVSPAEWDEQAERSWLGATILNLLPSHRLAAGLGIRDLAQGLADGSVRYDSWSDLLTAVMALEPQVKPADVHKLEARERATVRIMEEAEKKKRRSMLVGSLVSLSLLAVGLGIVYWALVLRPKGAEARIVGRMIEVPAGEFIFQDGKKETLSTFYIDQYEVTIGQYAEFLDFIEKNPSALAQFEHPKQPRGKSHVPAGWADQELATGPAYGYYTRAKRWGKFNGAPLDVNSPVFGVDWFDAYAYAKWKGHRLPTEKEWEKAARGPKGFKYPWGDSDDTSKANTGADFNPNPELGGAKDGFKRSSPVDSTRGDKSPFGIFNMAGNVSEWTDTYDQDSMSPGLQNPVIKGGNWRNPDYTTTRRILLLTDLQNDEALGFRTVSDTPPPKATPAPQ